MIIINPIVRKIPVSLINARNYLDYPNIQLIGCNPGMYHGYTHIFGIKRGPAATALSGSVSISINYIL